MARISRIALENNLQALEENNLALKLECQRLLKLVDAANGTALARRGAMDKLKGVARFYRSQRDRVDAYLSAVLDMTGPPQRTGPSDEEVAAVNKHAMRLNEAKQFSMVKTNRPLIQEPDVRSPSDRDIDRMYRAHSGDEPVAGWEDL